MRLNRGGNFCTRCHVCPRGVAESRAVPAGEFKSGVISFPGLIVALPDRAKPCRPRTVTGNQLVGSAGVKEMKLRTQPGFLAVKVLAVEGAISAIPTVAQYCTQSV